MTLATLKAGEKGRITKIEVEGAMKRRLMDMGLLIGEEVSVDRAAPFGGPIEITIKGYNLSLRKKEAQGIIIDTSKGKGMEQIDKTRVINVAVTGNPNAGKSTLVNSIADSRLHVGNWPGVTVEKKVVELTYEGYLIRMVDLPGTYSLSPYTQEQIIARDHLLHERPDLILNVLDSTNLERNLFLTIELLELGIPIVAALNIYDEAEKKGYKIDISGIEKIIGVKAVATVSPKKRGINDLVKAIVEVANNPDQHRPKNLIYDEDIEDAVKEIQERIKADYPLILEKYPHKWLALKLLEEDKQVLNEVDVNINEILSGVAVKHLIQSHGKDIEDIASDARYAKASGLTHEILEKPGLKKTELTEKIDAILLNKIIGLPIFLIAMWMMFKLTFDISTPFVDWINAVAVGPFSRWTEVLLKYIDSPLWFISLVTEGMIGGAGFVLVFVPVIAAMMFLITFLEGSGYMARAAFLMDRAMHSMGLHGNSFIPMILGFGCNVPAIYATRTLESPRDRILTSLLIPLISCSARLPVYVLFIGVFFTESAGTVLWSLYMLGIVLAITMGIVFKGIFFKGEMPMFILELPPYRIPTMKNIMIHTWEKVKHYVVKAGTVILAASILVWFLLNLPFGVVNKKDSLLGKTGQVISVVFKPLGFGNWEAASSLITGIMAKEIVVGTMSEIYLGKPKKDVGQNPSFSDDLREIGVSFISAANKAVTNIVSTFKITSISAKAADEDKGVKPYIRNIFTPLSAYAFMVFVLLYMPCLVTAAAFRHEFGTWYWFGVAVIYELILAYGIAFIVYQGGRLLGFGG